MKKKTKQELKDEAWKNYWIKRKLISNEFDKKDNLLVIEYNKKIKLK